jgi:sugar lactone lactonase YvrE
MLRSLRRAGVVASLLALAAVTALGGTASGSGGGSGGSGGGGGVLKVVADGLDNPRGIAFGPDGALYVAESGEGGPPPCVPGGPEGGEACFGRTGAVTRITKHSQNRVLKGLPSVSEPGGFAALGPVDLGFSHKAGYLLLGCPACGADTRQQFGAAAARLGKLLKVNQHGIRAVADFVRFEVANNPDQGAGAAPGPPIDSNPNGLLVGKRSQLAVDAGGNDLLKVDHRGRIKLVAVFPTQTVPNPGIPDLPPELEVQSVPTSVVKGPDGAYYVGELTGFPFPVGGARVWRVVPGHDPEVFAEGFTNIIDIAFDKRGRLYVLEIATEGLLSAEPPTLPVGRLVRVDRDGSQTTLAREGLEAPGGFVLGHGAAYITNRSVVADAGQVVKVRV